MSKIIIGGGGGLCGSHLSRFLLNKGYQVVILDNFSESYPENLDFRAKFYLVDIKDKDLVKKIFEIEKPDYVYSAQAMAAEVLSPFIKYQNCEDNILTTINLLNNSVNFGVKKFIHFSSIARWAGDENPPYFESTPPKPLDSYGLSKVYCDLECQITKQQFGLDYSIVTCHNYQGIFLNWGSLYRNFLGIAVRQSLNNENITVFSDGLQTRQFSDVSFLCLPLEQLLYTDCEMINLGTDISYKIIDVANIIKKIAQHDGKNIDIVHLESRHEGLYSACNHDLAKKKLDFKDETDIEKLCYNIYYWAKQQPKREPKRANYEVVKNLYSFWK